MTTFKALKVSDPILKALEKMGFEEPTPIQQETIPHAVRGEDIIGQAQTGTGKTAAFGIPMIERFSQKTNNIKGLIVAPTRELAIQVAEEMNRLGRFKGVRALPIYGGQHMQRQIRALKERVQIVVATPGRLLDHMKRRTIQTSEIDIVVLDEADEMLQMGFIDDIRKILKQLSSNRQTLLFSATMPKEIEKIATTMMKHPKEIKMKAKALTVTNIAQYFIEVSDQQKFDTLTNHLDVHAPELSIAFARTKRRVDEIAEGLQVRGFRAEGIHGDLTQGKRTSVLNQFKRKQVDVLVATDVAARGLDISDVTHVYNFDLPQDPESYVHRIGRTGRAGQKGRAFSFVTPRELPHLRVIEQVTKNKIKQVTPPSYEEAIRGQQRAAVTKILEIIQQKDLKKYHPLAYELLQTEDSLTVVAAALSIVTKERNKIPIKLSATQPIRIKGESVRGKRRMRNRRKEGRNHTQKSNRWKKQKRS